MAVTAVVEGATRLAPGRQCGLAADDRDQKPITCTDGTNGMYSVPNGRYQGCRGSIHMSCGCRR